MSFLLPPLPPHFDAALRDVQARAVEARLAAAHRLSSPDPGRHDEARDGLRALLSDRDARVRAAAVEALAEVGEPEDHGPLRERLLDRDPMVRELAVVALAAIPHDNRSAVLLHALRSPHPEVRFQALSCCAEECPEEAAPDFLEATRDADGRVRQNAARVLAASAAGGEHADAVQARLRQLLDDDLADVAFEAACALGQAGGEVAARRLLGALESAPLRLRAAQQLALHDRPEVRRALAEIATSLVKPAGLRVAAAAGLLRLGMREPGVRALRRVLRRWRSDGRVEALQLAATEGLTELRPEVARLAARGRGALREVAQSSLSALDAASPPG